VPPPDEEDSFFPQLEKRSVDKTTSDIDVLVFRKHPPHISMVTDGHSVQESFKSGKNLP